MSTLEEIKIAMKLLRNCKTEILHCVSEYPTNFQNLSKIKFFEKKFKKRIGFSDHTDCIITPSLAVINGAHIIEKHLHLINLKKWETIRCRLIRMNLKG